MATRRMMIGRIGEDIAAAFLARRGAAIVDRNLRVGRGEIDLLVELGGQRIAVEVKTATTRSARPEESFDDQKEHLVRRAAEGLDPPVWRVDLVAVVLTGSGVTVRWVADGS